jgi:hypothetical protein
MAYDRGEPPVHWIIHVDPRGETSFKWASKFFVMLGSFELLIETQASLQAREFCGKDQR